uniref:Nuclear pore complex protein Nup50 n=1 Tax=Seriola lalandi dorsalis TaxID=1841481 RepID=A0A3B4Y622_SERLL
MAKRIADKELTDRNWDQEEEGEEAGTFSVASEDVLKNRAIKKAKRRNLGAEGESPGAFKGFKGFSLTAAVTAAAASGSSTPTLFSGFGNGGGFKGIGGLTNGNSIAPSFGGFSSPAASTAAPGETQSHLTPEYSRQLTALNCSVRDWITKHVNDNPLCDLNPIFRDYERHLSSIERQYGAGSAAPSDGDSTRDKSSAAAPIPAGITFNFGQKVDSSVLGSLGSKTTTPSFSFSSSGASSSQTSLFGAPGSAAPLSFSGTKAEDNGEEESEEPPKPDIKEVKEDDAFYSKKCKMFYKKDSEFKEKGVGTLHLKQTAEGKTQLLIRADTNLGNILLNIMVQSSMPCSRVGKNNVMVVCVPNPSIDDKNPSSPVPLLIRVKTAEDADDLHKILEEKKG